MIPIFDIFVVLQPPPGYALVPCAGAGCEQRLAISHEDAREANIPRVAGWRKVQAEGHILAYCRDCSDKHLPSEEELLYYPLQDN